jgi:hypothetical protein
VLRAALKSLAAAGQGRLSQAPEEEQLILEALRIRGARRHT